MEENNTIPQTPNDENYITPIEYFQKTHPDINQIVESDFLMRKFTVDTISEKRDLGERVAELYNIMKELEGIIESPVYKLLMSYYSKLKIKENEGLSIKKIFENQTKRQSEFEYIPLVNGFHDSLDTRIATEENYASRDFLIAQRDLINFEPTNNESYFNELILRNYNAFYNIIPYNTKIQYADTFRKLHFALNQFLKKDIKPIARLILEAHKTKENYNYALEKYNEALLELSAPKSNIRYAGDSIEIIKVIYTLSKLKGFKDATGKKIKQDDVMKEFGKFLSIKTNDYNVNLNKHLNNTSNDDTIYGIFNDMREVIEKRREKDFS